MHHSKKHFCDTITTALSRELRKAIMLLSKLKNVANKDKKNIDKYQPNFCLKLLRKTKNTILPN